MKQKILFILILCLSSVITANAQSVELTQEEIRKITDFEFIYPFSEKLSKVMGQGKWGYINYGGETKIPLKYDDAGSFIYGVARVRQGAKFSAIDFNGKQIMPWFDYVYPFYNGLAKVKNRNEVAFVTKEGKFASTWFDDAQVFYYGLYKVKKGRKWAFMDKNGKVVTQWYFNPDTLTAKVKFDLTYSYDQTSKVAVYNEKGQRITEQFPGVFFTHSFGNASLFDSLKFDKYLAVSEHGLYTENISMVKNKDGKYAFINDAGTQISEWYVKAENFYEGMAMVMKAEGKMAYLGINGKQVTPWVERVHPFFNRLAMVENNNKFAFIDKTGELVTDWFDYASPFSDGLAKVSLNKKWGYIDSNGKLVIPLIYDDAISFSYGFARVESEGKQLVINKSNKVLHGAFDYIYRFTDSIAAIQIDTLFAYIDQKGVRITPWLQGASDFTYGIARVRLNNKVALINNNAKVITPWYEVAYFIPPHIVLGDTLPNGKLGRYILFDLYKYDNFFNKYPSTFNYDNYTEMAWNYTDREPNMSWNDGFFKEGIQLMYKSKDDKVGIDNFELMVLADYNGKPISAWYNSVYKSDDGYLMAQKGEKFVMIDVYGTEISQEYEGIYYHNVDTLLVKHEDKFAFIDRDQKFLTLWYEEIGDFVEGYSVVKLNGEYALMASDFKVISGWYEYMDNSFTYQMRRVKKYGKWGAIDNLGFDVVDPVYDEADFINGLLRVKKEKDTYLFDSNRNLIRIE